MKQLKNCVSAVFLLLCFFSVKAQDDKVPLNEPDRNKPKLFADLPARMEIKIAETESLLNLGIGSEVSVQLTGEFLLKGAVVSTARDASVSSVVVRSTNRPGAVFTFTKSVVNGQTIYMGRIISMRNADAYEIVGEKNRYTLVKKDFYDLIAE